ncbi:apolipoprotein acyltransferase [Tropicimonas sp. TH_r6]|uniref:apolipoprotein acyltransferase n=1 Tax=Tropicimonas sp. TH_r6 TaxID=3082085 RepID=UPI002954ABA0|nr:apolipoprotein acyltransferase [Tropicimonas sp. TH_r6]MDV7142831.1 apolipoprotein acyltransferase [Tropicimonas sp. TH_r6]
MIVILAALAGAIWGGLLARKRGGKPADIAQYAAGYAIAFALAGLFVTIALERML